MQITAFEVREDEIAPFENAGKRTGAKICFCPDPISVDRIHTLPCGSAVSILGLHPLGEQELSAMRDRDIRYAATRTIGTNHIDLTCAKRLGIHVCNVTYEPEGVADFTIMMMLLCLRNYKQALWRANVNDFSLNGLMGRELKDLTVGIWGTGRIGACVARELTGFGCRILGCSRHENPDLKGILTYVSEDEMLGKSDIITLHLALSDATRHIVNEKTLQKMKDGVILINCSRGALMDTDSVIDAVEKRKIGALGLDCMEDEEGIVHRDRRTDIFSDRNMAYLRQFKNVVHTQHMAFYTDHAVQSMVDGAVDGILAMAAGKPWKEQLT